LDSEKKVISRFSFRSVFSGTSNAGNKAARRNVDEPNVAGPPIDNSPNWSFTPRAGRILREMLGVNEAILRDGSVAAPIRHKYRARVYLMLRSAWDRMVFLRRNLGPSALTIFRGALVRFRRALRRVRRVLGLPSAPRRTVTMLVADDRIDRRVLLSARSLHRAGWRVRVIAVPYPGPTDEDQCAFPEIEIHRISWNQAPDLVEDGSELAARGQEWNEVYPGYFHFLDMALRYPARLFVAHDLPVLASAVVAAQTLGADVAYDAHELYPEQHHFKPEYVDILGRAEAELIPHAELVTTINPSIAEEMAKRYRIKQPAVILNAPAASPNASPVQRSSRLRDRLGLADRERVLLFQGRLSAHRNLEALVRAMAFVRAPEVVLVFLGPDGGKRGELEQIAREGGLLGSRIHFLDPVSQDELQSWTAAADVGIVPYPPIDLNSRLCTPNKLFEFIVAEVPILANDLPELRRFVVENGFGIARSMHNPATIAAAIDEVMSADPSAWRAALHARSAEFVWDLQGDEVVRLYERFRTSRPGGLQDIVPTFDTALDVEEKL
jgi:glycosyltransferase involved in cell wall biosynthesis